MRAFDYFIKIGVNLLHFFFKFKKTNPKKVVFISRLSDKKSLDFVLIEKELLKDNADLKCEFLCKRIESFSKGLIGNVVYTIKCLNALSNAKVCVTDSFTIAVSTVKHKKSLKVIQIWHSLSAVKKFGYQTVGSVSGRDESTAKILKMHLNYDYIISGSKAMKKYFAEAFGYSEEFVLPLGLPRIDYLIKNEKDIRKKILNCYPCLCNKKNILYAPTFRTTMEDQAEALTSNIDLSKYNLIIKSHERQKLKKIPGAIECNDISSLELLTISDYVITDYSAIAVEAASINKKTLYFVFDYDKYIENNGLNLDLYEEMPGCVFSDAKKLYDFIETDQYDENMIKRYKDRYIEVQDGTSTCKICKLIRDCTELY